MWYKMLKIGQQFLLNLLFFLLSQKLTLRVNLVPFLSAVEQNYTTTTVEHRTDPILQQIL